MMLKGFERQVNILSSETSMQQKIQQVFQVSENFEKFPDMGCI